MTVVVVAVVDATAVDNHLATVVVAVVFEENSILPLPERLESSGWQFLRVEVSQESLKNR